MKWFPTCLLLLSFTSGALAAVSLPDLFSEHAVLQKSAKTAVWGSASPGEKISVALGTGAAIETTAYGGGGWRVELDLANSAPGPFDLSVKGEGEPVVIHDVMVGDVWLCSGQSNMEWKLAKTTEGPAEVAASENPRLRCFLPKRQAVGAPPADLGGKWVVSNPANAGNFTAIGYYFAKTVQANQKIAIGLIDTSWGGTPAEAWVSSEGLDSLPEFKPRKDAILTERPQIEEKTKHFSEDFKKWAAQYQREDRPTSDVAAYAGPDVSTADWKDVNLPGTLASAGLPDSGVVWLRREVEVPASMAKATLPLLLGTLHDFETVYWNGKQVGATSGTSSNAMNPDLSATTNRRYNVPEAQVNAGKGILAIRLYSPGGGAGIEATNFKAAWSIPLSGAWKAKVEYELPALTAEAQASYPRRPPFPSMGHYTATYLYNGLVQPMADFSLKGVLWYQGEANAGRAHQYRELFPLLIQDWRRTFQRDDLPFYFCQLANHMAKKPQPGESGWAELRDAQTGALTLPQTGMAVLIDLGEEGDIHPRNKKDAGERLGAVALANTYGQKVPWAGPTYQSAAVEGGKIRLRLAHTDGGLVAKALPAEYQPKSTFPAKKPLVLPSPGSEIQGFAVCGADRQWKWAQAKIEGEEVLVWSEDVPAPQFVRYAWADNPTCNLYNGAGFPAAPFRTDDFADSTVNGKF